MQSKPGAIFIRSRGRRCPPRSEAKLRVCRSMRQYIDWKTMVRTSFLNRLAVVRFTDCSVNFTMP